jgi:hypothetical protein
MRQCIAYCGTAWSFPSLQRLLRLRTSDGGRPMSLRPEKREAGQRQGEPRRLAKKDTIDRQLGK